MVLDTESTAIDCTIYFAIITPPSLGSAFPTGLDCILYIFWSPSHHRDRPGECKAEYYTI
ncbi:hypothetical protein M5D96_002209 [Drosophila gunungcola]|uniref:Uncharacterized protein n=1 Tax=Drosophila gunungcola TaxID=103775 RepID=A0A9Q0BW50_9MUSC|nr:hypothetical protein M5D96_002209 [Drosophila gunungcola]